MSVIIGTSGWQYADWRGRLYPRGLAQREWLTYYADRFQSVEVNNVFYRLPEKATFKRWAAETPEDFEFSLKASRYLTHVLRLSRPTEPVRRLLSRSSCLCAKRGPILLQLPANFQADPAPPGGHSQGLSVGYQSGIRATPRIVEYRRSRGYLEAVRCGVLSD